MSGRFYPLYATGNRLRLWFFSVTTVAGRLVCALFAISLFFGMNTEKSMFFQLFPPLLLLLCSGFCLSRRFSPSLACRRLLPETCIAGQRLSYVLIVENTGKTVINGAWFQERQEVALPTKTEYQQFARQPPEPGGWLKKITGYGIYSHLLASKNSLSFPEIELPPLPPGCRLEIDVHLTPRKRGNLHLDGFQLARKDPFGLLRKTRKYNHQANLLILPQLYPAPQLSFAGSRKYHQGGLTAARSHGDSEEFMALRDYTSGDPLKHIDWKSSAKTRQLIVKQFKSEYFSRFGLVLDTFAAAAATETFEEGVSIAASLLMSQHLQESVLDLLFVGPKCYIESTGKGLTEQQHMLKILAGVEACRDQPFTQLINLLKSHCSLLSGLVIILIDLDQKRKDLLDYVQATTIPTKTLLVTASRTASEQALRELGIQSPVHIIEQDNVGAHLPQL